MAGGRIEIEVVPDVRDFPSKLSSGLRSATGLATTLGRGLGTAIAAGTAVAAVGLAKVIELGNQYTSNLNELQAVTGATGIQMARVGQVAKELGSDLSLPGTSAADAAAAMKELAKGGLDVDEAMTAAKGTLQLAAAAQIEAAQAAEIQSDALNQFGLAADQAGHVADVLANTANAASGEITDMANALKYIGPVARGLGVDIDNTAAAIGLLAVNGIRGEQAGTSLRGILASLASPSKEAAKAMDALGIVAFDQSGKFVGLRTVTEQLSAAKGKLTDAEFAAAASTAFGNEGFTAANALALAGAPAFDAMAAAVSKAGGAAEVSAAKTKGLGGAWDGLKSQLETVGIGIFEAIDGPLERLVRAGSEKIDTFGKVVVDGLNTAVAAGEVYGPRLAAAISSRASVVGSAVRDVFGPIATSLAGPLNEALNTGIELWDDFTGVIKNAVDGARPVASGIAAIAKAAADGDGPVSALGTGLGIIGNVAQAASVLLVPLGAIVGGIASAFAALPGPIQTAVIALGLIAAFRGPLGALGDTIANRVTTPFRHFGETIRLQQALLTGSSQIMSADIGRVGLAMAALEARVPVIGRMADAYRGASTAAQGFVVHQSAIAQAASGISGQYTGVARVIGAAEGALRNIAGAAAGAASALGSGLRSAGSGLVNLFGGPWGAALALAGAGLSLLASEQERAARETQKHANSVQTLSGALRESNGLITENVRVAKANDLAENYKQATAAAKLLGISQEDLVSASLKQGDAYDVVKKRLAEIIEANTTYQKGAGASEGQTIARLNETGIAASKLAGDLTKLAADTDAARKKNSDLAAAMKDGRASLVEASESGRTLSAAMAVLASTTASADDRARALKDALSALSGGSVNLEAAQVRMQETLQRLRDLFGENVDKTKGWGDTLLNANGSLNVTTENGRNLSRTLADLSESTAEVASKTYDMAIAQGDTVPSATAKAQAAMQSARDAFVATAGQMGITAEAANVLADRAGLIPSNVTMLVSSPGSDKVQTELMLIKGKAEAIPDTRDIHVNSLSDEAQRKLEAVGFTVERMPGGKDIIIRANDGDFNAKIAAATAPASKTITIRYFDTGVPISARGSAQAALSAQGNLFQAYASGGIHKLTPMRGGLATMVKPNTWRVVGDRLVDDEAYIPVNRSARSVGLLNETAERMGFALLRRYASGGIASGGSPSTPIASASLDGVRITGSLMVNGLEGYIDGRVEAGFNNAGTALGRGRR